ncbi:hypothetical protein GF312_17330 [Candidatus Poribacteria bacterium]|nr:hypothetical protein [Candidatus Poribacteria bacterium]
MWKKIFVFGLTLLAALFLITGCGTDIGIPEEDIYSADAQVVVGDLVWEIVEVEDRGVETVSAYTGPIERRILGVTFKIENKSNDPKTLVDITMIDDNGNRYPICLEAFGSFDFDQVCVLQEIPPGAEKTYSAAFAVPTDANRAILEVTDLGGPALEYGYIELGI